MCHKRICSVLYRSRKWQTACCTATKNEDPETCWVFFWLQFIVSPIVENKNITMGKKKKIPLKQCYIAHTVVQRKVVLVRSCFSSPPGVFQSNSTYMVIQDFRDMHLAVNNKIHYFDVQTKILTRYNSYNNFTCL